MILALHLHCSI